MRQNSGTGRWLALPVVVLASLIVLPGTGRGISPSDGDRGGGPGTFGVAASEHHVCRRFGGSVVCIGRGNFGQLGDGTTGNLGDAPGEVSVATPIPFPADEGSELQAVAAGALHTCGLFAGGGVRCVGFNGNGQLGTGNFANYGDDDGEAETLPVIGFPGDGATATQVAAGGRHTCVLFDNGRVRCFGRGEFGETGRDSVIDVGGAPGQMSTLPHVNFAADGALAAQVSAGAEHTCVVFSNGGVRCFGRGLNGRLGTGSDSDVGDGADEISSLDYIAFSHPLTRATQVAAGSHHTCVLFENGGVKCFGKGTNGALGTGASNDIGDGPEEMTSLDFIAFSDDGLAATQVASGGFHNCVLFENGGVRCFGFNLHGQLGIDTSSHVGMLANQMSAIDFIVFSDTVPATQLSLGELFSCVLFENGGVRCFGGNDYGELGIGSTVEKGNSNGDMAALDYVPMQVLAVSILEPAAGHLSGGEPLTLVGNGFIALDSFSVRFSGDREGCGTVTRNGTELQVSPVRAEVRTPPFPCLVNTTIHVSVSRDGGAWSNELPFVLYDTPSVTAIDPAGGPIAGGTAVTVYGANLLPTASARCRFQGHGDVPFGSVISTGPSLAAVCVSPPSASAAPASAEVTVALNGRNFSASSSGSGSGSGAESSFEFRSVGTAQVSVPRGPVGGGTPINVTVEVNATTAQASLPGDAAIVRFRDDHVAAVTRGAVVLHSAGPSHGAFQQFAVVVACTSPDVSAFDADGVFPRVVRISVSLNDGEHFSAATVPFEFYRAPTLISVSPPALPIDSPRALTIVVRGSQLLDRDGTLVRFRGPGERNAFVPAVFANDTSAVVSAVPPGLVATAGRQTLALSLNGGADFSAAAGTPVTVSFFSVISVFPLGSPAGALTRVTVAGEGMVSSVQLACTFGGDHASPAAFISASSVECLTPAVAAAATAHVEVTVDGVSSSSSQTEYSFYPPMPTVTSIAPALGPSGSGPPVTLHGSSLADFGGLLCRFGEAVSAAISVSSESIVCRAPVGIGAVPVHVAQNGVDFTPSPVGTFSIFAVFSADPLLGPTTGGTSVVVSGSGFDPGVRTWRCRFGDTVVPAVALSAARIACSTPAMPPQLPGSPTTVPAAPIAVSGDAGVAFSAAPAPSDSAATFTYFLAPTVTAIAPVSGPSAGGTRAVIYGTHLSAPAGSEQAILCRFGGGTPTPGTPAPDGGTACATPAATGTVVVDASLNGGADFSFSSVVFSFFALSDAAPHLAPAAGGSEITISGSGFSAQAMASTKCRFRETRTGSAGDPADPAADASPAAVTVAATRFLDSVRILCRAPALPAGRTFEVGVTADEATGFATRAGVAVATFAAPVLGEISPAAGPAGGGTAVTIQAEGIPAGTLAPLCRFGDSTVVARVLDGNRIACTSPAGAGAVDVRVSFNGAEGAADLFRSSGPAFAYFSTAAVAPALGPASGGTVVTVTGGGFLAGHAEYGCVIEDTLGTVEVEIPGAAVSGSGGADIECTLPSPFPTAASRRRAGGVRSVLIRAGVSRHATARAASRHEFTVYDDPSVTSVHPASLPASGGLFTVRGSGFLNTTSCRIGGGGASGSDGSDGSFAAPRVNGTGDTVLCLAPRRARASNLSVAVTSNGQQVHVGDPSAVTLTFTACDPGYFAEFDTDPCQPCEPGSFSSSAASRKCEVCPATAFAESAASTECTACPEHTSIRSGRGDTLAKCMCDRGFYHPGGVPGEPCLPCPSGATCDGISAPPAAREGFWSSADAPAAFVTCENPVACLGGEGSPCAEGYTGRVCAECEVGFYKYDGSFCEPCPPQSSWILVGFGVFCSALVALLLRVATGRATKPYTGTLGIAASYFQIIALIAKLAVRWPREVTEAARIITSPFTLSIDLLASECSMPAVTYETKWLSTLALPIAFGIVFGALYIVAGALDRGGSAARDPRATTGSDTRMHSPKPRHTDRVVNAFMLLLSLGYLRLVSTALEILSCTAQEDGNFTLVADPSLLCYTAWWWRLIPVATTAIFAYGFGIPAFCGLWLRRNRERIGDRDFACRYGSLYGAFRRAHPYWESVVMLEKFLVAAVGALFTGFVSLQVGTLALIFCGTLFVYRDARPYHRHEDNTLHAILRWCSVLVLMAAQAFHTDDFPNPSYRRAAIVVAVGLICLGTAVVLAHVAIDIRRIRRQNRIAIDKELKDAVQRVFSPHGVRVALEWFRGSDPAFSRLWQERVLAGIRIAVRDADTASAAAGKHANPRRLAALSRFCSDMWLPDSLAAFSSWLETAERGDGDPRWLLLRWFALAAAVPRPRANRKNEVAGGGADASDGHPADKHILAALYGPLCPLPMERFDPTCTADPDWLDAAHRFSLLSWSLSRGDSDADPWAPAVPAARDAGTQTEGTEFAKEAGPPRLACDPSEEWTETDTDLDSSSGVSSSSSSGRLSLGSLVSQLFAGTPVAATPAEASLLALRSAPVRPVPKSSGRRK